MQRFLFAVAGALFLALAQSVAWAAEIMPSFATAPSGWTVDRYAPNSFGNVGTFAGRNDVLGIGISPADGFGSRPSGFNSTFYNTQGRSYDLGGAGAGNSLSASLYISTAMLSAANGHVRTDMWASMFTGVGADPHDYGIIGFTNYGGAARLRVWDANVGWVDLGVTLVGDTWVDLSFAFDGISYEYSVDGNLVYTDLTTNGAINYDDVIMQAYNFNGNDPAAPGAIGGSYTASWANIEMAAVPEPTSLAVFGLGVMGLTAARRRRRA